MVGEMQFWESGDAVSRAVALLLLCMSVATWVVIVYKAWWLHRAVRDVARGTELFWQARDVEQARERLQVLDRSESVLPLVLALQFDAAENLGAAGTVRQQITRRLRGALHQVLARLRWGQVLLATVGSTAPFVGLLGTVWGIFHALTALSGVRSLALDQVAAPVGEALVMTAAGLAVAIPAVLAYNVMGRVLARLEADLEGFALDLCELAVAHHSAPLQT